MTGRAPRSLTPAQKAEVETLAAVLNAEQIADYFGIGRTTFYSMMKRDEEIEERYKKGKARAIGAIAQTLIQKARSGDTTSMIFYLKTQGGWRETALVEHDGSITASVETDADAAQLNTFLAKLGQRMRAEAARTLDHDRPLELTPDPDFGAEETPA